MKRIALIPAYEPEQIIRTIVKELKQNNFDIVVVDDGSGPSFAGILTELREYAHVISYNENHGKGYALKCGLSYIEDVYEEGTVITLDADGQHLVTDAIKVCRGIEAGECDLAIGSRRQSKSSPIKSRLGNGITRRVYRMVTGLKVYDTQSGLRAFSIKMLPSMQGIPGDRYEYEMNVLLYMAKHSFTMKEIPIETIYFDKNNSVSHFNALTDSWKIYKEIIKFVASSFASFLVDYSLYALLMLFLGGGQLQVVTSNVLARVVSASVNFYINKKYVFRTNGNVKEEAFKYFGLAMFILIVNSIWLSAITYLGMNAYLAKIIVELIMFVGNYIIQHFWIFKKESEVNICSEKIG